MSHGDAVSKIPEGFIVTAESKDCPIVSVEHTEKKIFGL